MRMSYIASIQILLNFIEKARFFANTQTYRIYNINDHHISTISQNEHNLNGQTTYSKHATHQRVAVQRIMHAINRDEPGPRGSHLKY